jgi:DNA-binding response OmpR family regulator
MKVLIIDDDEIARELLSSTLGAAGFEVFELPTPIGATKLLIECEIDAVVLDVMMPEISGDKLAKLLRANSRLQALGVVLVSSMDPDDLEELGATSRACAVVQKSRVRDDLARAVTRATNSVRSPTSAAS